MKIFYDSKYKFYDIFDPKTGFNLQTGIIDSEGKDTGVNPFQRSYPRLIDVGIMGHCIHGASGLCVKSGVQCYQDGLGVRQPNMRLFDYESIVDQSKGKVQEIAIGRAHV